MRVSAQSADISYVAKKRAWLCLLLALLFLYNPFLVAGKSTCELSVAHPPSYRATVASSELLKFENPGSRQVIAIADVELFEALSLFQPQLRSSAGRCDTEDLTPVDQSFSSNLWFRPPPAA